MLEQQVGSDPDEVALLDELSPHSTTAMTSRGGRAEMVQLRRGAWLVARATLALGALLFTWRQFAVSAESAQLRSIPEDNLAYPAMVTPENGKIGSGFYTKSGPSIFLVTARHVLLKPGTDEPQASSAVVISYPGDPKAKGRVEFVVDVPTLQKSGLLAGNRAADVAVMRIGQVIAKESSTEQAPSQPIQPTPGITFRSLPESGGLVGADRPLIRRYEDVLVSNQVFVFGYPISLGFIDEPQFDYERPLIKTGIVAGKNAAKQTLILDCAMYGGNSGGPVVQVEDHGLSREFSIVGVVLEFIPYADQWQNVTLGYKQVTITNSGYAVAASMDSVLDLIDKIEKDAAPKAPTAAPPKPR
jgi:hypothetical protein